MAHFNFSHASLLTPFMNMKNVSYVQDINQTQIDAVIKMKNTEPAITIGLKTFQDSIFMEPFEIIMGGVLHQETKNTLLQLKPEIRVALIQKYWMPWCRDVDTLTNMIGYAPFYFKVMKHLVPVDEDDNLVEEGEDEKARLSPEKKRELVKEVLLHFPVCVNIEMGRACTFVYEKSQYLAWRWNESIGISAEPEYDTSVFFIVENMPTLKGDLTSRMASLLTDWQHIIDLKLLDTSLVRRMVYPERVVEFTPNIASMLNARNQDYIDAPHPSSFFPNVTVGNPPQMTSAVSRLGETLTALNQFQSGIRAGAGSTDIERSGAAMGYINAGLDMAGSMLKSASTTMTPTMQASDKLTLFMANNPDAAANIRMIKEPVPNSYYLNAFERVVPLHAPTQNISDKIQSLQIEFDRNVAVMLNNPAIGQMRSSARSSVDVISQENTMHQRIRFRIKFFAHVVKQVFQIAFLTMFKRAKSDIQRLLKYHIQNNLSIQDFMVMEDALDFNIIFKPAGVLLEFNEITILYQNGVLNEDEAFNMYYARIGFTDPPLKAPAVFKKRMQEQYRQPPEAQQQPQESQQPGANKRKREDEGGATDKDKLSKKARSSVTEKKAAKNTSSSKSD